jgi:hypothetical protein
LRSMHLSSEKRRPSPPACAHRRGRCSLLGPGWSLSLPSVGPSPPHRPTLLRCRRAGRPPPSSSPALRGPPQWRRRCQGRRWAWGLLHSTRSTRNDKVGNHDDDVEVSTKRESSSAPWRYRSTTETRSEGSSCPAREVALLFAASAGEGEGLSEEALRQDDGNDRTQKARAGAGSRSVCHVSGSVASTRNPAVAELAAPRERPSR